MKFASAGALAHDFEAMLSRLSNLYPSLPGLLALALLMDCGGKPFTAGAAPTGTAGSGGLSASAGNTSSAGDGGSANDVGTGGSDDAGAAGSSETAGSAGKGTVGCDNCAAGTYCQEGTKTCRPCADFARLEFAEPELLSTLNHSDTTSERFPRSAYSNAALFYTEDVVAGRQIWFAPVPTSGIGSAVSELSDDSGPLLAPGFAEQNFFFDRQTLTSTVGTRKIWMANWMSGALSGLVMAPEPTNTDNSSDYSIAVAPDVGRAYWMSTRNGAAQLIWESINETPMLPPVELPLKIRIGQNSDCTRLGDDSTPWVDLGGSVLLFSAESMNDTCAVNDSHARDLFAVPLNKTTGQPQGAAVPLSALNMTGGATGSDETDPSFAPDACSIYFASDNGTGNYDLYRAARN